MTAVGSAIAELEAKRAQIDEALTVLRRVENGGAVMVAAPIRTAGTVKGKTRKPGTRATPETWAEARKRYEAGADAEGIAKQFGVTTAAIYWQAKHHGWKRPKVSAGAQLSGQVRCPSCQAWTNRDPCEHCGKAVRK